jgi:hypothetical protein
MRNKSHHPRPPLARIKKHKSSQAHTRDPGLESALWRCCCFRAEGNQDSAATRSVRRVKARRAHNHTHTHTHIWDVKRLQHAMPRLQDSCSARDASGMHLTMSLASLAIACANGRQTRGGFAACSKAPAALRTAIDKEEY